jgi:hypothetical protein
MEYEVIQSLRISPAPIPLPDLHYDPSSPDTNRSMPLLVFIPAHEQLSHSVPRQFCHYEGDEWILDEDGERFGYHQIGEVGRRQAIVMARKWL